LILSEHVYERRTQTSRERFSYCRRGPMSSNRSVLRWQANY